jgi:hypothetical protein
MLAARILTLLLFAMRLAARGKFRPQRGEGAAADGSIGNASA